jgi:hypothetical protein
LEGRFVPGSSESGAGAVVAPPHPLYGGELSNPVVGALVAGLNSVGIAGLAFNYRGVGGSDGQVNGDLGLAGWPPGFRARTSPPGTPSVPAPRWLRPPTTTG